MNFLSWGKSKLRIMVEITPKRMWWILVSNFIYFIFRKEDGRWKKRDWLAFKKSSRREEIRSCSSFVRSYLSASPSEWYLSKCGNCGARQNINEMYYSLFSAITGFITLVFSISPENIRKPVAFYVFGGGVERYRKRPVL